MPYEPDRRAILTGLAGLIVGDFGEATASRREDLLNLPDGALLASAGLIARGRDGRVTQSLVAGHARGSAGLRPFALDQPFRVASVSKMITASVFLAQSGLDLDQDASDALGFPLRHPAHPRTAITIRMLMSHTSGLRNGPSYPVPLGHRLEEAFTVGGRNFDAGGWFGPADQAPGEWFAYADVNFALVAQVLERRTRERFDLFMSKTLFRPMKLDIGYNWSGVSSAKRSRAAAAVRWNGVQWAAQVDGETPPSPVPSLTLQTGGRLTDLDAYRPGDNGFVFSPHGGLRLSLSDMDRLARLYAARGRLAGHPLLPRSALDRMQTRAWTLDPDHPKGDRDGVFQSYGLGCETPVGRPGPGGDAFFGSGTGDWRGHFGDAYGWITAMFWNIRDGRTLVYALNGMPEVNRPPAMASCLTAPEERLIAIALNAGA